MKQEPNTRDLKFIGIITSQHGEIISTVIKPTKTATFMYSL